MQTTSGQRRANIHFSTDTSETHKRHNEWVGGMSKIKIEQSSDWNTLKSKKHWKQTENLFEALKRLYGGSIREKIVVLV